MSFGRRYEAQLERKGGNWFLTITISAVGNYWTSKPAMLDAETEKEAHDEATRQIRALRAALEGPKGYSS
jgi:hypothetical protein